MPQGTFEEIEIAQKLTKAKALGCERERRIKGVALSIDRKTLAAFCDCSYSYLSEILNTNNEGNQKPWPEKFTGAVMLLAPERYMAEVGHFDADVCGYEHSEKKRPLTPDEENKLLREQIRRMGLDVHPAFKTLM